MEKKTHAISEKITAMPGVNIPEERVFNHYGIKTISDAYDVLRVSDVDDPQRISEIASYLKWSTEKLRELYNKCEMVLKIKGLATMNLKGIVSVGVNSIEVLAESNPESLHEAIQKAKGKGNLKIGKMPSLNEVSGWIESAQAIVNPLAKAS